MTATKSPPRTWGAATVNEAADFIGVSRTTLYVLMDAGTLPFVRIGKRGRRIPWRALHNFLEGSDDHIARIKD